MGTIVCKTCGEIIEHFDHEKASVLYGICRGCTKEKTEKTSEPKSA